MLQYYKNDIQKCKDDSGLSAVNMKGAYDTCYKVVGALNQLYDEVAYMDYDIGYHGWSEDAAAKICDARKTVQQKMNELYGACLAAMGMSVDEAIAEYERRTR